MTITKPDLLDSITSFANSKLAEGADPRALADGLMAAATSLESQRSGPAGAAAWLELSADQLRRIAAALTPRAEEIN